ncbi:MAG: twin-arginine translocase TatA/TatE family subunit [Opitutus sp.]|nr:twin-arginine translocase TatA/TatE family subunit [Opitutus sp.]
MTISTAFLATIMGMGPGELGIILVILLVLFGGSKLPGLAKGIGQSIKEFKKAAKEGDSDEKGDETKSSAAASELKKVEPAKTHGSN